MYSLLRPLLFSLEPEKSHAVSMASLELAYRSGLSSRLYPAVQKPLRLMGLTFPNRVGLAAGLDKDGDHIDALGSLGFGFIEIGTVTPRPQAGNPKPRLFRLPQANAIINRMGFNNLGVEHLVGNAARRKYSGVLGINIGKNADTPLEGAVNDYRLCIRAAHRYADYLTVNISSPNTPGLRELQGRDELQKLASNLSELVRELDDQSGRRVPLLVKIAPDLAPEALRQMADALVASRVQGIIATNTTLSRRGVEGMRFGEEKGGLSGEPVREMSNRVIACLSEYLQGALPIIGVGGIASAEDAADKIRAGADLIQIYSGFIYQGPALIGAIAREI